MNVNVNVMIQSQKQPEQSRDVVVDIKVVPQRAIDVSAIAKAAAYSVQRAARRNA